MRNFHQRAQRQEQWVTEMKNGKYVTRHYKPISQVEWATAAKAGWGSYMALTARDICNEFRNPVSGKELLAMAVEDIAYEIGNAIDTFQTYRAKKKRERVLRDNPLDSDWARNQGLNLTTGSAAPIHPQ